MHACRYERVENNGWRPIAERLLVDEDPTTTATRMRSIPNFNHNPAVRRWVAGCVLIHFVTAVLEQMLKIDEVTL